MIHPIISCYSQYYVYVLMTYIMSFCILIYDKNRLRNDDFYHKIILGTLYFTLNKIILRVLSKYMYTGKGICDKVHITFYYVYCHYMINQKIIIQKSFRKQVIIN